MRKSWGERGEGLMKVRKSWGEDEKGLGLGAEKLFA